MIGPVLFNSNSTPKPQIFFAHSKQALQFEATINRKLAHGCHKLFEFAPSSLETLARCQTLGLELRNSTLQFEAAIDSKRTATINRSRRLMTAR
jgi:hypothetical protein